MDYFHFGQKFRESKFGSKLNKKQFLPTIPDYLKNDFRLSTYISACEANFDINMQKFSKLSKEEFEKELNNFIIKNPQFKEISNINDFKEKTGYYLLVLDEYKQIYIGTSNTSLRNRIYKHMSENILFENFLFPPIEDNFNIESVKISMEQSKLSINTFRPLDFTRVFIFETTESFDKEEYFIRQFSNKFVSNRIEGGHIYNFNEDCYIKAKFLKD